MRKFRMMRWDGMGLIFVVCWCDGQIMNRIIEY